MGFDALSGLLAERSTSDVSVVSDGVRARDSRLIAVIILGGAESGLLLIGVGGEICW
jgi:hypothetical protein